MIYHHLLHYHHLRKHHRFFFHIKPHTVISILLSNHHLLRVFCNLAFTIQKHCMALKILDHGSKEYQQMVNLRNEVLRKPLGLAFTNDELESEKKEILIGAFEDDKMLGCCMLIRTDEKTCRLRQMAVINNLQGKGIGRAL